MTPYTAIKTIVVCVVESIRAIKYQLLLKVLQHILTLLPDVQDMATSLL